MRSLKNASVGIEANEARCRELVEKKPRYDNRIGSVDWL